MQYKINLVASFAKNWYYKTLTTTQTQGFRMDDFVKEKVLSITKTYAHSGAYVVTLKPEYSFDSAVAPQKMSFGSKNDALMMIRQAKKLDPGKEASL